MDFPRSFWIMRAMSTCDNSRSSPRMVPSTSRRYRSFSPSVISQSVISLLQIAIAVKGKVLDSFPGPKHHQQDQQQRDDGRNRLDNARGGTTGPLQPVRGNVGSLELVQDRRKQ